MTTDLTPDQLREHAAEILLDHARDVERLSIREHLDDHGLDDHDDTAVDTIQELISTADITIGWSDTNAQPAEICGEVGTSFTADHEPHYTDPCRLPANHDELHDWAQREADGKPSPAQLADRLATATAERDERLTLAEFSKLAKMVDNLRQQLDTATTDRTRFKNELAAVRDAAYRQQQRIDAERAQWQAEIANLVNLIAPYDDEAIISIGLIRKALREGPAASPVPSRRAQEELTTEYLIWSHHHKTWFAPNGCGYRSDITDAGRFSLAATKRWLGRGCGCCLVPEVVIPAPGTEVLTTPGMAGRWASEQIEAATKARIEAGEVNSWAACEPAAPKLAQGCPCGGTQ